MIEPHEIEALRLLDRILTTEGWRFVIIGASAMRILIQDGRTIRPTFDIDAVMGLRTWEDFDHIRRVLLGAGFRQGSAPYEFEFGQVRFDLLPFGPGLVEGFRLTWRESGRVMSTLGFAEAFASAEEARIADGVSIPVVPMPGLVLLKIIAYQDRPGERVHDLTDIVDQFEQYGVEGERRFDVVANVMVDGRELEYEYAGAYLLGLDVGALATSESLTVVRRLLEVMSDQYAVPIRQILSAERRIESADRRRAEIFRLFRAFAEGLANATLR